MLRCMLSRNASFPNEAWYLLALCLNPMLLSWGGWWRQCLVFLTVKFSFLMTISYAGALGLSTGLLYGITTQISPVGLWGTAIQSGYLGLVTQYVVSHFSRCPERDSSLRQYRQEEGWPEAEHLPGKGRL